MIPDRIEAALWAAYLRNRNVDAGTAGDGAIPVAGGYAIFVADSMLDYAIGAGSTRPLREDDLAVVEEFYAARSHAARFELDAAVLDRDGELLRSRGYTVDDVLLSTLEAPTRAGAEPGPVAVRTTTNRRGWAELAGQAFADCGPQGAALAHTLEVAAEFASVLCVASLDGQDVGVAGLAVYDELALLVSGAVLPAFRGRGVHGALIGARLALAHARGATRAVLKTAAGSAAERSAHRFDFAQTGTRRRVRREAA